ncbi:Transcription factor bHLH68, partial [Cucurbita argyrosperma subsp. argyrosperma]
IRDQEHRVFNQTQITHYHPTKLENFQHQILKNPNFAHFSCNSNNPHHRSNRVVSGSGGGSPDPDRSLESNRSAVVGGGACKKARVHPTSSTQPPLKVRKEKLVDRITALHQIVSPFGKTDTASVLSEAIGYIRFLQGQIEALSYPYLRSAPKELTNSQPLVSIY